MIDGCPIRPEFRHVFASKFVYDDKGVAIWPAVGVNYTTKTQYLFRINKGVLNHWEHEKINRFMADDDRPVPFERMIFLGDGDTDVPTMKMMHTKGGYSIAVYDPRTDAHHHGRSAARFRVPLWCVRHFFSCRSASSSRAISRVSSLRSRAACCCSKLRCR